MAVASSAYKKALTGESQNKQVLLKIDRVTKKFDDAYKYWHVEQRATQSL